MLILEHDLKYLSILCSWPLVKGFTTGRAIRRFLICVEMLLVKSPRRFICTFGICSWLKRCKTLQWTLWRSLDTKHCKKYGHGLALSILFKFFNVQLFSSLWSTERQALEILTFSRWFWEARAKGTSNSGLFNALGLLDWKCFGFVLNDYSIWRLLCPAID